MFERELNQATKKIEQALKRMDIPVPERIEWMPVPYKGQWGYGTNACFQAAAAEARLKKEGDVSKRAHLIAEALVDEMSQVEGFARANAEHGYLNLFINPTDYIQRVVNTVIDEGDDFGRGAPKDERIMVEYAQPNTHHSFHIGHARNAVLGESLARIVEFAGFETIRASYPGDIGLGVITCMWAYQKFHYGQEPEGIHTRGQWLAKIYSEATAMVTPSEGETEEESATRETYEAERRQMYQKWNEGDSQVRELWRMTRQWSLDELEDILRILGVKMDVYFFESEVDEPAKAIVDELIELGIADDERPDGPVIVKID